MIIESFKYISQMKVNLLNKICIKYNIRNILYIYFKIIKIAIKFQLAQFTKITLPMHPIENAS